jgi:DNA-directed RNA polymerase subunit M/transcription elongation factor TFIIS
MKIYKYQIYCQACHYRKIFGDEDVKDLSLQKSVDIQSNIPTLNPFTKKIETPKQKKGKSKIKCPKCGRITFIMRYNEPKQDDNPSGY